MTGEWKYFDGNGEVLFIYDYSKNDFVSVNSAADNQIVINGNDTLYCKVDRPVLFEGGSTEILNYLMTNIRYPEQAAGKGVKGRVFVGLVIDETGKPESIYIIRGVEESLNNEALCLFSGFKGHWFPAVYQGQTVKSVFVYPVMFNAI